MIFRISRFLLIGICSVFFIFLAYRAYSLVKLHLNAKSIESRILTAKKYVAENKNEAAIDEYNSLLAELINKEDVSYMPDIFFDMGNVYLNLARANQRETDYEQTIKYFSRSLIGFTKKDYPAIYAASCHNIGMAYRNLWEINKKSSNLKESIKFYVEALDGFGTVKDNNSCAEVLSNLGSIYYSLARTENTEKNLRHSINAFQEAREFVRKDKANLSLIGVILSNQAGAYRKMANIRDKKKNLTIALNLYTEVLNIFPADSYPEFNEIAKNGTEEIKGIMSQDI